MVMFKVLEDWLSRRVRLLAFEVAIVHSSYFLIICSPQRFRQGTTQHSIFHIFSGSTYRGKLRVPFLEFNNRIFRGDFGCWETYGDCSSTRQINLEGVLGVVFN
jgi:hypothetical protein